MDVGDDRHPETGPAHARQLSRAARPCARTAAQLGAHEPRARTPAGTESRARVSRAQCRHLQRPVRVAGRSRDRRHGRIRHGRVRRARRPVRDRVDGASAGRHGDAVRRSDRGRPRASAVRAQHHRAALAVPSAPVRRQVRRRRVERLWPGRDRRGHRLDRRRCARASRQAGRGRSSASGRVDQDRAGNGHRAGPGRSVARSTADDRGRHCRVSSRRRGIRRHRRPRPRRRRGLRVDRRPGERRHQSRWQQSVPGARRGGAARRRRRRGSRGCGGARRPAG